MKSSSFWDFCAPLYDFAEWTNRVAYAGMLSSVRELVPPGASVLETAAGTGAISVAVADKAKTVLCTDISENMLRIARRKTAKFPNVTIEHRSIYALGNDRFDVVIAGQVFHLLDDPQTAAAAVRQSATQMAILPMSFTKHLRGATKLSVDLYRFLGFAPKAEFDAESYAAFLCEIGFADCRFVPIDGKIPMTVAVWEAGT